MIRGISLLHGLVLAGTLALAACDSNNNALVGQFTDSPVSGLQYSTASQSGVTDHRGRFIYRAGEMVTFSLGNTVIGEPVLAKSQMNPLDLVPGAPLISTRSQLNKVLTKIRSTEHRAFRRLANILVFLQSLDQDALPDNGITIPEELSSLLQGVQIDFDQEVSAFRADPKLRRTTHQAARMGYLSTAAVEYPNRALDHFYRSQGITHQFARPTKMSVDRDGDGLPGAISTWGYDADGNQISFSIDHDADGTVDIVSARTFDADGNMLSVSNAEGFPNSVTTWTYEEGSWISAWQNVLNGGSVILRLPVEGPATSPSPFLAGASDF